MKTSFEFKGILSFTIGLFIMALGVSLSVKADLGVTPISCVPYVFSTFFPFSLGQTTIAFNCFFVLMQICILRKNFQLVQLLQLPAVAILGFFIDFTATLLVPLQPASYADQMGLLLASCVILALGVYLVVNARVICIPGDGLVVVISDTFTKNFGKTKISFDSLMVLTGVLSSLLLIHDLVGIREGTVIAALLIGFFVQLYGKAALRVQTWRGRSPI